MGWTDVSLNSQAMLCEKYGGKSTIGFFHAAYAFGAFIGVLYGGIMTEFGVPVLYIFVLFTLITFLPAILSRYWLFSYEEENLIHDRVKVDDIDNDSIDPDLNNLSDYDTVVANNEQNPEDQPISPGSRSRSESGTGYGSDLIRSENDVESPILSIITKINSSNITFDGEESNERNDTNNDIVIQMFNNNNGQQLGIESESGSEIDSFTTRNALHEIFNAHKVPIETSFEVEGNIPAKSKMRAKDDFWLIFILCCLGGLAYAGEGSIGDWSTAFLVLELKASPLVGVLGYAVFQLVVCIGRYSSDIIVEKIDRRFLLKVAGCLSCFGLGVVGLSPSLPEDYRIPCAVIGFGICGAGISVVAPLVIYYAGKLLFSLYIFIYLILLLTPVNNLSRKRSYPFQEFFKKSLPA